MCFCDKNCYIHKTCIAIVLTCLCFAVRVTFQDKDCVDKALKLDRELRINGFLVTVSKYRDEDEQKAHNAANVNKVLTKCTQFIVYHSTILLFHLVTFRPRYNAQYLSQY